MDHRSHATADGDGEGVVAGEPEVPAGLTVADAARSLVVSESLVPARSAFRFSFRIDGPGGPIEDFDLVHDRRMHLILARRDLARFLHLHPLFRDGTWTVEIEPLDPGVWRAFADFSTRGTPSTLGIDLHVAGDYRPESLPASSDRSEVDGFEVQMSSPEEGLMRFEVTTNGSEVRLDSYLGARGHLVVLRDGDLAFLHVHPTGDALDFAATYPSPGRYGLFLQFSIEGRVHLARFTVVRQRPQA